MEIPPLVSDLRLQEPLGLSQPLARLVHELDEFAGQMARLLQSGDRCPDGCRSARILAQVTDALPPLLPPVQAIIRAIALAAAAAEFLGDKSLPCQGLQVHGTQAQA
jgi:hypothetical protein